MDCSRSGIYTYLLQCGLSPKHKGFGYALDGILLRAGQGAANRPFCEVYQSIANMHKSSPSAVRKAIQNALDYALLHGSPQSPAWLLQSESSGTVRCSEFLSYSAHILCG